MIIQELRTQTCSKDNKSIEIVTRVTDNKTDRYKTHWELKHNGHLKHTSSSFTSIVYQFNRIE